MDALKIQQANVFGYSLGGDIAQQFAINYPEKVNRIILVAGTCGGKDSIPKPPEFMKLLSEIVNKSLNNGSYFSGGYEIACICLIRIRMGKTAS